MPSANGFTATLTGNSLNSRMRVVRLTRDYLINKAARTASQDPSVPDLVKLPAFPQHVLTSSLAPPADHSHFLVAEELPRNIDPEKIPAFFSESALKTLDDKGALPKLHAASLFAVSDKENFFSLTLSNTSAHPAEAIVYFNNKPLESSWYVFPGKTVTIQGHHDLASGSIRPFSLDLHQNEFCHGDYCQRFRETQCKESAVPVWNDCADSDVSSVAEYTSDSDHKPSATSIKRVTGSLGNSSLVSPIKGPNHDSTNLSQARSSRPKDHIRVEFIQVYRTGVRPLAAGTTSSNKDASVSSDSKKPPLQWVYSRRNGFPLAVIDMFLSFLSERLFTLPTQLAQESRCLYYRQLPSSSSEKRKREISFDDVDEKIVAETKRFKADQFCKQGTAVSIH